jgi:transglutaminase-like putative cysteine protease
MNTLPLELTLRERIELAPSLTADNQGPAVAALIAEGRHAVKDDTIGYPTWLATHIANRIEHQERTEDGLLDLEYLLLTKKGACRDKAALFIACCRAVGFPARFVSGYQHAQTESGRHELHGWAEIYFPGGGWRAYDPSLGVACQDDHATLCAASQIELTNPIIGSTRGGAVGEITYTVIVSRQ